MFPPDFDQSERTPGKAVHRLMDAVSEELASAMRKHGPIHSGHEGYAVILEELDEVKAEVWKRHPDRINLRKELIQVAAMAVRMAHDLSL